LEEAFTILVTVLVEIDATRFPTRVDPFTVYAAVGPTRWLGRFEGSKVTPLV